MLNKGARSPLTMGVLRSSLVAWILPVGQLPGTCSYETVVDVIPKRRRARTELHQEEICKELIIEFGSVPG